MNPYFDSQSDPIKIIRINNQSIVEPHVHDFHELVFVFNGKAKHLINDESYDIATGDIFLIKPGIEHSYQFTKELDLVNLLYFPEKLELNLYDLIQSPGYHAFFEVEPAMRKKHGFKSRLHLGSLSLKYMKDLVKALEHELEAPNEDSLFMSVSYFMQILSYISRSYLKVRLPEHNDVINLSELISYLEKNYMKDFSIAELAAKASMSKITLYRNFKKAFGVSPIEYVLALRLNSAAILLEKTDMNISEIARSSGFNDINYFSKQFKKRFGTSPRQHRARQLHPLSS